MFVPSLKLSWNLGAIDVPNSRKVHLKPTARAGGFSFFIAFSLLALISQVDISLKIPLLIGSTLIFLVGFLDDTVNLSPFMKLSGQFLSLSVYHFSSEILGYNIAPLQAILVSAWIIFITNATNIIDGLDGLAAGVSSSQVLCLSIIAIFFKNHDVLICSILLLGAILGFMPHNFPKSKIFMGDCGALFIGFVLGVLSSRIIVQSTSLACLVATLIIFRVPIYDAKFSIARRLIRGKNPFRADKGHFHHQLLRHGFSKECVTLALITLSLTFGLIGIVIATI
jgi:UDP-GlcNAc:undecaprenyl-phosphate GlcNAc-1-phosphate transferase